MTTLLLRLVGPMQSWGTSSRFRVRETGLEPSKSGVVGLLCAALGKPRVERPEDGDLWPSVAELANLRMGVRVDRQGEIRRDYQTVGGTTREGDRSGVVSADGTKFSTVASYRYYLTDAQFLVGLESRCRSLLERLQAALLTPEWPLYLGRKAFVPSVPVALRDGLQERPLDEALRAYPWFARNLVEATAMRKSVTAGETLPLRIVCDAGFGSTPDIRQDVPIDFQRRVFTMRHVRIEAMLLTVEMIKEESECFSPTSS